MRRAIETRLIPGLLALALAIAAAHEFREPQPAWRVLLVAGATLVALSAGSANSLALRIAALGFLFCVVSGVKATVPIPFCSVGEKAVLVRPLVLLVAAGCALEGWVALRSETKDACALLWTSFAVLIAACVLGGYVWISRHYSLDPVVFRSATGNILVAAGAYPLILRALSNAPAGRGRRVTLLLGPVLFCGANLAGKLG